VVSAVHDARGPDPIDIPLFIRAGETLLSGGWLDVFADEILQVGPLHLLLLGLCNAFAGLVGLPTLWLVSVIIEVGTALAVMWIVGLLVGDRPGRRWAQLAAGLAAVATGIVHGGYMDGHPAQIAIPVMWVLAGLAARSGHELRSGVLVGLSAGLELWGVLGAVVLLLGRPRRAPAGIATAVAVLGAMFAPFVLAGDFRMFEYEWRVGGGTLVTLVLDPGTPFSWPMRLVQAAAAVGAGAAVAWLLRRSPHAVWAVPLAVVVTRVVLDPSLNGWYLNAAILLTIVGAAALLADERVEELWHRRRAGWRSLTGSSDV
jgi:hypothetical protein